MIRHMNRRLQTATVCLCAASGLPFPPFLQAGSLLKVCPHGSYMLNVPVGSIRPMGLFVKVRLGCLPQRLHCLHSLPRSQFQILLSFFGRNFKRLASASLRRPITINQRQLSCSAYCPGQIYSGLGPSPSQLQQEERLA